MQRSCGEQKLCVSQGPNRIITVARTEYRRFVCNEIRDEPEDRLHRAFPARGMTLGFTLNFPTKYKRKAGTEEILCGYQG